MVGVDSQTIGIRVTDTEQQRLEELRKQTGLRSKAQVIRMALDLLEVAAIPGTFMMGGAAAVRRNLAEHDEVEAGFFRKFGVAGVELDDGRAAAGAGLSPDQPPGGEHST
jgi:hypothetical protein